MGEKSRERGERGEHYLEPTSTESNMSSRMAFGACSGWLNGQGIRMGPIREVSLPC
jgi:hypothetical protein